MLMPGHLRKPTSETARRLNELCELDKVSDRWPGQISR